MIQHRMPISLIIQHRNGTCHQISSEIVPVVGSYLECWGTMDDGGNYNPDPKYPGREIISGRVYDVKYSHSQEGHSPSTCSTKMHVIVCIEDGEDPERGDC